MVDPLANAARFFAFTYFLKSARKSVRPEDAGKYARSNWKRFLPCVHSAKFLTTPALDEMTETKLRLEPPLHEYSIAPSAAAALRNASF